MHSRLKKLYLASETIALHYSPCMELYEWTSDQLTQGITSKIMNCTVYISYKWSKQNKTEDYSSDTATQTHTHSFMKYNFPFSLL